MKYTILSLCALAGQLLAFESFLNADTPFPSEVPSFQWDNQEQDCYSPEGSGDVNRPWENNRNNGSWGSNGYNGGGQGHNGNRNGGDNGRSSNRGGGNIGNSYKDGAGVRAKGELTAYFGYDAFQTDHFFNAEGDKKAIGSTIYAQTYTGFFEYGLTEFDTVTANINYTRLRFTETPFPNINGFRDIDLGWKRLLWEQENDLFSFNIVVTVPSGSSRDQLKAIRAGRFAELVSFQYSHEFQIGCRPAGFDLSFGYRFYQGFPSDAVVLGTGLRSEFMDNFLFIAALDLYDSVGNGRPFVFPAGGDPEEFIDEEVSNFALNNSRFLAGNLYLCYTFQKVTATIGTYRILWGRNFGAQTGYFGGLTFTF